MITLIAICRGASTCAPEETNTHIGLQFKLKFLLERKFMAMYAMLFTVCF